MLIFPNFIGLVFVLTLRVASCMGMADTGGITVPIFPVIIILVPVLCHLLSGLRVLSVSLPLALHLRIHTDIRIFTVVDLFLVKARDYSCLCNRISLC